MRRLLGLEALERVEARRRASTADPAAEAAARVEDLRRQMAELATAIKALELRAQDLGAGEDAAHAERQVEVIDGLLDSVRKLRGALDQQREELVVAEQGLEDAERQPARDDETIHPRADGSDA